MCWVITVGGQLAGNRQDGDQRLDAAGRRADGDDLSVRPVVRRRVGIGGVGSRVAAAARRELALRPGGGLHLLGQIVEGRQVSPAQRLADAVDRAEFERRQGRLGAPRASGSRP